MVMTLTQLRSNLYNVIDEAIITHKPVQIERNGQVIELLIKAKKPRSKLDNLLPHPNTIVGDPEDLVHMDWSSHWNPEDNA